MKQTTIKIHIQEEVCGATIFATSRRTKWNEDGSRKSPLPEEEQAWRLIAGENAQWGVGRAIEPKRGEFDDSTWFWNISERIERVCNNRKFKSKVRVIERVSQGYAIKWAVTFYWDKPKEKPCMDTYGVWKLKEFKNNSKRGKIIAEFDGFLECHGDDIYCHLPNGDVPEGYDVYPDYNSVIVAPKIPENVENLIWWEFDFKRLKRQPSKSIE